MMSRFKQILRKKGLLIGGCLLIGQAYAGSPETTPIDNAFPLVPGFSAIGLAGNGWTAFGDALVPILGATSSFTFVDPQIYYHSDDNEYTGSVGVGQRWLTDRAGIVSAYVFGDYNHSINNNDFWYVSPGIQSLGRVFDLSANLYIPVSSQRIDMGTMAASQTGDFNQVVSTGHMQTDALVNTFESVGWGGDAEVGVRLQPLHNTRVYVGGYYFDPKDASSITGGVVRTEIPVNRYVSILASEAYDSEYNNTLKAGLSLSLGGRSSGADFTGDLRARLVDPIHRSLIALAGGSHTGEPVIQGTEDTGQTILLQDNISFFVSETTTNTSGDGTYENPYVGMSQDNIDDGNAQDNRNFYIESGTYYAMYGVGEDSLLLNNDQLYGRQNDFKEAAFGNQRPVIYFSQTGFEAPAGDTSDSLTGLQLMGLNDTNTAGIYVNHDSGPDLTVSMSNLLIQGFGDGVDLWNQFGNLTFNVWGSDISNNNGSGLLDMASGGLGAWNTADADQLSLNIVSSNIHDNIGVIVGDYDLAAVGGVAIVNEGNSLQVTTNYSNFFNNTGVISIDNPSSILATSAGGLAISNYNADNLNLIIDHSNFFSNENQIDNEAGINVFAYSAGGLAIANDGGDEISLTVKHSNFFNNNNQLLNETVSAVFATSGGGLAIANDDGAGLSLVIDRSNFFNNDNFINNETGFIIGTVSAGGLGIANYLANDVSLTIDHSSFSNNYNQIDNDSNSDIYATSAGGLALANRNGDFINLTIDHSSFFNNNNYIDEEANTNISTTSVGGLALASASGNNINVAVDHSNFFNNINQINNVSTNSSILASSGGGLALASSSGDAISLAIDHSSFFNNDTQINNETISQFNILATSAGGLAFSIVAGEDINLAVDHSSFFHNNNQIYNESGSSVTATSAGGLAMAGYFADDINVIIKHSNFFNNENQINNETDITIFTTSAGGLAIANFSGDDICLIVDHSSFFNNHSQINNEADSDIGSISGGGLAIADYFVNGMSLTVDHSHFFNNDTQINNVADSDIRSTAGGGLAIADSFSSGVSSLMVDHSSFFNNTSTIENSAATISFTAMGGLAVANTGSNTLTMMINHSKFFYNDAGIAVAGDIDATLENSKVMGNETGIDAQGGATVDLNHSIIFGNTTALFSDGGMIAVNNPVFFKGSFAGDDISFNGTPAPTSGYAVCFGSYCLITP